MALEVGTRVLRERYELLTAPAAAGQGAQSWGAENEYGDPFLIKTWAYEGTEPDRVQRALWDGQLRTLYKIGSTPGADDRLVVLKDAGVDREAGCFAMVLEAPGHEVLAEALADKSRRRLLTASTSDERLNLWSALERLAEGLDLLHGQRVIHREVSAESVRFSALVGFESLRLGGFEWSLNLGRPAKGAAPQGWSTPPELQDASSPWRPDDDWYGFGVTCARLLLDLERYASNPPEARGSNVLAAVTDAKPRLVDLERDLILRLIAADPLDRMSRSYEVLAAIASIKRVHAARIRVSLDERPYTLEVNLRNPRFVDDILDGGFEVPAAGVTDAIFNPNDVTHSAAACTFMQRDLDGASLYAVEGKQFYVLVGRQLTLRILPHARPGETPSWTIAFSPGRSELRASQSSNGFTELPLGRIAVRTTQQVARDRSITQTSASWEDLLPRIDPGRELSRELSRFHEFVRATNQIELLLQDAEIFPFDVVGEPTLDGAMEVIVVTERQRPEGRKVLRFFEIEKGLTEFLQRQQEQGRIRPDASGEVIVSDIDADALVLPTGGKDNQWRVRSVDLQAGTAELERDAIDPDRPKIVDSGIIRSSGLPGATRLLRRRKQAIDALDSHSYLLRSVVAPGQVFMDTGFASLPVALDPNKVDQSKRATIEDILRARPIYALQGPPGTGKTTLVAWLLREIIDEDPVAQILVTAQAHGAVDVLRSRVADEAFGGVPPNKQPLAVRLGARVSDPNAIAPDSVESVALQTLETSVADLTGSPCSPVQQSWIADASEMITALRTRDLTNSKAADYLELVKRGANLTYCTTSAGELEAIAADQSFDWSIVEEAGKAHAFDLALPLQAGHRWLLIGDHKQLPPYRFEDYRDGLDHLDEVVESLQALPNIGPDLIDWDWTNSWRDRSSEEREAFKSYARGWLRTFQRTFENCASAAGGAGIGQSITREESIGADAGMLLGQHRMHPTIGSLISEAYYDGGLENLTTDDHGLPLSRVVHPFIGPGDISGKAVVWLNTPWSEHNPAFHDAGPYQGRPRYSNDREAEAVRAFLGGLVSEDASDRDLAVLAPYTQQVNRLRGILRDASLPDGLTFKRGMSRGLVGGGDGVHTVDSFQGNQASVVVVSLVRNNGEQPEQGLGFLDDASRLNVLLSRAEELLVLVGSWDFFLHQTSTVELDDRANPLWHWKRITSTLGQWFESGRAALVDIAEVAP